MQNLQGRGTRPAIAPALMIVVACAFALGTNAHAADTFAVIGDYGDFSRNATDNGMADVASMIDGWSPNAVLTVGDNSYDTATDWDNNVGNFYGSYIEDPTPGSPDVRTAGVGNNNFFPAAGNHDWDDPGIASYLDYFVLPTNPSGNERYYDVVRGDVHFFVYSSHGKEPDDDTGDNSRPASAAASTASTQGQWLKDGLEASTAAWQVVLMHHAPFASSASHGSNPELQLAFGDWGADLVLAGHDHNYERLEVDGLTYVVTGTGGHDLDSFEDTAVAGSVVRNNGDYGALQLVADTSTLQVNYFTRDGKQVDSHTIGGPAGLTVLSASFQQGTNGYASTVDTFLDEASSGTDNGASVTLETDTEAGGSALRTQSLMRFENLFVSEGGSVPDGATIVSATLELHTIGSGSGASLHQLLRDWEPGAGNATWTDWGDGTDSNNTGGVQTDDDEALAAQVALIHTPEASGGIDGGYVIFDVTESILAWLADPSTNHGWLFNDIGTDGWDFDSSEGTFAPRLTINYTVPEPTTFAFTALAALTLAFRRKPHPSRARQ